jgi:hypothetical protein
MPKTLKTLFVVLLLVFAFASSGEAAPKQSVRHRSRHSSRVATGSSTAKNVKKKTKKSKRPVHRTSTTTRRKAPPTHR